MKQDILLANQTNPMNLQDREDSMWPGQVARASDGRAIFWGPVAGLLAAREHLRVWAQSPLPSAASWTIERICTLWTGREVAKIESYILAVCAVTGLKSRTPVSILDVLDGLCRGMIAGEGTFSGPVDQLVDFAVAVEASSEVK